MLRPWPSAGQHIVRKHSDSKESFPCLRYSQPPAMVSAPLMWQAFPNVAMLQGQRTQSGAQKRFICHASTSSPSGHASQFMLSSDVRSQASFLLLIMREVSTCRMGPYGYEGCLHMCARLLVWETPLMTLSSWAAHLCFSGVRRGSCEIYAAIFGLHVPEIGLGKLRFYFAFFGQKPPVKIPPGTKPIHAGKHS